MALIICPECGKEVSELCENCPNCGYPILNITTSNKPPKSFSMNIIKINNFFYKNLAKILICIVILGLCVGYKSICDHKGRMVSLAEIFEKELTSYDYLSNSLHDITNIKIMIKPICNLRDVTIYLEVLDSQNIVVFKDLEFKGNLNKNIEYNIEFNLKISSILSGRTYRYYLEGNKSIFA